MEDSPAKIHLRSERESKKGGKRKGQVPLECGGDKSREK
jgi:hypothetical protein